MDKWNDRLRKAFDESDFNKAGFAKAVGVSGATVTDWMKGEIKNLRAENAQRICKTLNIRPEYLVDGKGPMRADQEVAIRRNIAEISRFDVGASMGKGLAMPTGYTEIVERISVNIDYLASITSYSNLENLALITGYGDSMEGTYNDGDLLLVDRGVNEIKIDAVYVLGLDGELYIKRIQRRPDGSLLMLSDNKNYAPYEIKNSEIGTFQVLARVLLVWSAKRL